MAWGSIRRVIGGIGAIVLFWTGLMYFVDVQQPVSAQIQSNTARHIIYGSSLPVSCNFRTGDVYAVVSGSSTAFYNCTALNTWTSGGGGGASGPSGPSGPTGTAPYTCTVSGVSSIACTHNLGTSQPWVTCYDGSGNILGGSSASTSVTNIVATSANVATITFSGTTTGVCKISTGGQGPTGATGATGATGPSGPSGVTGASGPSGPTGATGASGPSGPSGPATPGPSGPSGGSGPSGPSGSGAISGLTDTAIVTASGTTNIATACTTCTLTSSAQTMTVALTNSTNGASATPSAKWTGTWATSSSPKPLFLIEPSGTTSTIWHASGTGLGVNSASGFAGDIINVVANNTSQFKLNASSGTATFANAVVASSYTANSSNAFIVSSKSVLASATDGIFTVTNNAGNNFTRLNFGGTTSSFPAWTRSSAGLIARLADDSADTTVKMSALIAGGGTPSVDATNCTGATIGTGAKNGAGTITGLPTGTCSVVITFSGVTATTGWVCAVSDQTTANLFRQSANTTTTATFAGTSVASDVLAYHCIAY